MAVVGQQAPAIIGLVVALISSPQFPEAQNAATFDQ
jgi:hypothetical protein